MLSFFNAAAPLCPHCGAELDGAAPMGRPTAPKAGARAMCAYCGRFSVFGEGGTLRLPTEEEAADIAADPAAIRMRVAYATMHGRRNRHLN